MNTNHPLSAVMELTKSEGPIEASALLQALKEQHSYLEHKHRVFERYAQLHWYMRLLAVVAGVMGAYWLVEHEYPIAYTVNVVMLSLLILFVSFFTAMLQEPTKRAAGYRRTAMMVGDMYTDLRKRVRLHPNGLPQSETDEFLAELVLTLLRRPPLV